jgi:hypothetical protein
MRCLLAVAVALVGALAAGVAQAQPQAFFQSYRLNDDQIALIRTTVADQLHDKQSARFSGLRGHSDGYSAVAVCGFVNSRGPDGLMTGNVPFFGGMADSPHVEVRTNFTLVALGAEACEQCLHLGPAGTPSMTCWQSESTISPQSSH